MARAEKQYTGLQFAARRRIDAEERQDADPEESPPLQMALRRLRLRVLDIGNARGRVEFCLHAKAIAKQAQKQHKNSVVEMLALLIKLVQRSADRTEDIQDAVQKLILYTEIRLHEAYQD